MKRILHGIALLSVTAHADVQFSGNVTGEYRYFPERALYEGQLSDQFALTLEPEWYWRLEQGGGITFRPFYHLDSGDEKRTHGDIRELMWLHYGRDWELKVGIGEVFWGVTESQHLVDVINQTDAVQAQDFEEKLGQPMVQYSRLGNWGTFSAFVLPYFRERTFPGVEGRLRPPLPVDADQARYQSDREEQHVDYALRWSGHIGFWDMGLYYFDGTDRDPTLLPAGPPTSPTSLIPYYTQMRQTGLDLQATWGGVLYKLEALYRDGEEDHRAMTGGVEYTSVGVLGKAWDLGLLLEYQYDSRGRIPMVVGQNDAFVGVRWVRNDPAGTEILLGTTRDLDEGGEYAGRLEASSRLNNHFKWRVESYWFVSDYAGSPLNSIRNDDFIQLSLEYHF
ncbi:hypothetical protein [Marinimicrobium locisalis]|uniref:hypothetical protein n=1 Tax=Marinimicrobium locisalis TaxID=546022 RepID=UPI0032220C3C